MKSLRWAALAWAAFGCVLELPLADAQADASASCPAAGSQGGAVPAGCAPPPPPVPSPVDVLLSGVGILGSVLFLRKRG